MIVLVVVPFVARSLQNPSLCPLPYWQRTRTQICQSFSEQPKPNGYPYHAFLFLPPTTLTFHYVQMFFDIWSRRNASSPNTLALTPFPSRIGSICGIGLFLEREEETSPITHRDVLSFGRGHRGPHLLVYITHTLP